MQQNWGMRLAPLVLGLIAIGFTLFKGCQEGPFGRRQLRTISDQQEIALGIQAYQEVLRSSNIIREGPMAETVRQITRRLANASLNERFLQLVKMKPQRFGWEVQLVRSPEANAFCLPGGKMVVYTGILPIAQTEAGLATVMGHEICHALAHHGAERMSHQQLAQIGVAAAASSLGNMDPAQQMQIMRVLNAGAKFGILKYSRDHESEADRMGQLLMAAAGYDPREALRFWERMRQAAGARGTPPEFLSTHPSHQTRIQDLNRWMKEAMSLYEASNKVPDRRLPLGN